MNLKIKNIDLKSFIFNRLIEIFAIGLFLFAILLSLAMVSVVAMAWGDGCKKGYVMKAALPAIAERRSNPWFTFEISNARIDNCKNPPCKLL